MKKIIISLIIFLTIVFGNIWGVCAEEKKEDFYKYRLENTEFSWNVKVINGDLYNLWIEYYGFDKPLERTMYKNYQEQKNINNVVEIYFYKNTIFYKIEENNKVYLKVNNKILGNKFDNLDDVSFDNKWNIYAIWKKKIIWKSNISYFITKNWKKISDDFDEMSDFSIKNLKSDNIFVENTKNKYNKYYILNNNFYFLIRNNWKEVFYKNNEILFKSENIENIYYNNLSKKFYFKFVFGELKWISDGKENIISNFLDKNLPEYFDLKFSKDWKSMILINSDNTKYKIIWNISLQEEKKILKERKKEKPSFTFYNEREKIDFTKHIKFWFSWYDYQNNFYSTDKRFLLLKKVWKKYYIKNKSKLTEKKLNLLVDKIANKMKNTENIEKKETYLFLLLIIKDSSYELKYLRILKEDEKFLEDYEYKNIWFEYEPRYYSMDSTPIDIKEIKKTYEKENNRFILEVNSVLDKDERASAYYWWSTSNWYFKEFKEEEDYDTEEEYLMWDYKKVYFYPASSKPLSDYQIIVNWWDNLWYFDVKWITIKKDDFTYEKFDSTKVKTKLKIIKSDKYIFWTGIFNLTINAEENYLWKKFKPENYSVYLKSVDWEEIDKILVSKGWLDWLVVWKDKTIRFWMFDYDQKYEYFWKTLEFELELNFPHSVKSTPFKSTYLPQFRISWKYYEGPWLIGFTKKIYIWDFNIRRGYYDNDIFLSIPNEFVEKKYEEYIKNWKKWDFEIILQYGFSLDYYWNFDLEDVNVNFNSTSKVLHLYSNKYNLDENKIKKIKNKYAKQYFEYLLESSYSYNSKWELIENSFKKTFDEIKKELEWKEKNNLELKNLYLKILKNNNYLLIEED